MAQGAGGGDAPPLNIYYMKATLDQAHSRLGKIKAGQVVAVPQDLASRLLVSGAAVQVSSAEYQDQVKRKSERVSARQELFANLNAMGALGDVATHRDVLTAPDEGLRRAYAAGLPLANLGMLRDEDGNPLAQDADIDDILEARARLSTDSIFPHETHERSSVMGGGSHFTQSISRSQGAPPTPPPTERVTRATRRAATLSGAHGSGNGGPALIPPGEAPAPPPPPPSSVQ